MTLKGIDASAVQGRLPFSKLTIDFVILKAQQGNDGFDACFNSNLQAALDAGIEPFAYCFAYPLPHLDPKEQAKLFVDSIPARLRDRPIFLDLEWPAPQDWARWQCSARQISDWCEVLCAEVERLSGRTPVIYTYPWWWKSIGAPSWASHYPLWIASYVKRTPVIPAPWSDWLFWQYDGDGGEKLPNGVDADFNLFNGTKEDLQMFIAGSSPVDFQIVHPGVIG